MKIRLHGAFRSLGSVSGVTEDQCRKTLTLFMRVEAGFAMVGERHFGVKLGMGRGWVWLRLTRGDESGTEGQMAHGGMIRARGDPQRKSAEVRSWVGGVAQTKREATPRL